MTWALSAVGILALWLLGRRSRTGFMVGLLADFMWLAYALETHQYGMAPAFIVYAVIHVRSYRKWKTPKPEEGQ